MDDEPTEVWRKIDLDRPANRELMAELDAAERLVAPAAAKYRALQDAATDAQREMFVADARFKRTVRAVASLNDCEDRWNGHYDHERTTGSVKRAFVEWRGNPALNGGKAVA